MGQEIAGNPMAVIQAAKAVSAAASVCATSAAAPSGPWPDIASNNLLLPICAAVRREEGADLSISRTIPGVQERLRRAPDGILYALCYAA
jgi:hypothetical protein